MAIDVTRCEGGHPDGAVCGLRDQCARYTQLAKDRDAPDSSAWVGTPVIRTCMTVHVSRGPLFVRDESAWQAACDAWLGQRRRTAISLRLRRRGSQ